MLIVMTYPLFSMYFFFCGIFKRKLKSRNAPKRNLRNLKHAKFVVSYFYYLFELLFEVFIVCSHTGADVGLVFKLSVG